VNIDISGAMNFNGFRSNLLILSIAIDVISREQCYFQEFEIKEGYRQMLGGGGKHAKSTNLQQKNENISLSWGGVLFQLGGYIPP